MEDEELFWIIKNDRVVSPYPDEGSNPPTYNKAREMSDNGKLYPDIAAAFKALKAMGKLSPI